MTMTFKNRLRSVADDVAHPGHDHGVPAERAGDDSGREGTVQAADDEACSSWDASGATEPVIHGEGAKELDAAWTRQWLFLAGELHTLWLWAGHPLLPPSAC